MRAVTWSESAWRRALWLGLLIVASAALTTVYACITPFVAFAVIAATTLSRSGALALTLAVWLANQVVGYGALNYPWTARSVGWGIALGGAAVLAALTARWVASRRRATESAVWTLAAFVPAFAVHQLTLYALAVSVLGGTGGFSREIVGRVLVVNAVTLVGLYGLNQLAAVLGLAGQRASKSTAVVLPPLTTTPTRSPLAGA